MITTLMMSEDRKPGTSWSWKLFASAPAQEEGLRLPALLPDVVVERASWEMCIFKGVANRFMVLKRVWWRRCLPAFLKPRSFHFPTAATLVNDEQTCAHIHLQDGLWGRCPLSLSPLVSLRVIITIKVDCTMGHALPKTGQKVRHVAVSSPPVR